MDPVAILSACLSGVLSDISSAASRAIGLKVKNILSIYGKNHSRIDNDCLDYTEREAEGLAESILKEAQFNPSLRTEVEGLIALYSGKANEAVQKTSKSNVAHGLFIGSRVDQSIS